MQNNSFVKVKYSTKQLINKTVGLIIAEQSNFTNFDKYIL